MTTKLHISPDLAFPLDVVTQTNAVLGNRGSGKTYGASVLAEEMLGAKQQLVVVDPLGVWWGLRSSSNGKEAGYAILIVGGEHADVPLEEAGGKLAADFIVDSGQSVILDLVLLRKGAQKRFMLDFAEQLYHRNRQALHVMVDEADAFAPQRPQRGDERLLGAIEDWVRRGRARGIGVTLITQRSAVLNKNVLELAETLFLFRTTGPRSIDAIMAWVEHHGVEAQAEEMLAELPKLPRGDAFIWSPGYLGVFERVSVRERRTFDSSATPKPGERRVEPKTTAPVDLEKLTSEMKASAQRAKENDPKELRARIAALEAEAKKSAPPAKAAADPAAIEKAVARAVKALHGEYGARNARVLRSVGQLSQLFGRIAGIAGDAQAVFPALGELLVAENPVVPGIVAWPNGNGGDTGTVAGRSESTRPLPPRRVSTTSPSVEPDGDLPKGERAILTAAAQYPDAGAAREQLSVLTGYKASSRNTYIQRLQTRDFVRILPNGNIGATDAGVAALGADFEPLPTGVDLRVYWLNRLPLGEQAILKELLDAHPNGVDRGELSARTRYKPSSRNTYIQRLGTRKLVRVGSDGCVYASETLFD